MNLVRSGALLLAIVVCGCAANRSDAEFDISPTMLALRVDAQSIARDLGRDRLADARSSAQRFARMQTPQGPDRSQDWLADFDKLRAAASALDGALAAADGERARARFSELIAVCSSCHQRTRPDSGSRLRIEFDP